MAASKGLVSWIIMAILIVVGLAVGWSIWSSLKDARAKLEAQKQKMDELERRDAAMRHYADSLDALIATLGEREKQLVAEREELQKKLEQVRREYQKTLARLDKLWTAEEVNHELDQVFPHWAGQFWEATRSDGVHGLIAPRLWGAEVAEIKAELDKRQKEGTLQDSTILSFEKSMKLKDETITLLTLKADSLKSTYDNLFAEYQELDQKYRKEVKSHWFKFSLGNAVYAGVGLGVGFLVGNATK
jgi:predicted nuclease with TOPRIM domain